MMEIAVTVFADEMENYFNEAASKLSENMKISGFRPGKASIGAVEQAIGSQELFNEAAGIAVKRTFPKIILENKIEAVGSPNIKIIKIARSNDFEYKAEVAVLPEVKLPDYRQIPKKVIREKTGVGEKELKDALDYLRKSKAEFTATDRAAVKGDRIDIDFSAKDMDGNEMKNGGGKNRPLIIGDNLFIKDFEDNLAGMRTGEEKEFQINFPENYYDKEFSGKKAVFRVKVNSVQAVSFPELNDDFAKGLGKFSGLDELEKSIREGLTKEKELEADSKWQRKVLQKIAEESEMEVPEVLVDSEADRFIEGVKNSVERAGLKFEDYLSHLKKTAEDLKKENRSEVEKTVRIGLALKAMAEKEKVEVSGEEVDDMINKEALKHYKTIEEARKNMDVPRVKDYYYGIIRNEKIMQLLKNF